MARAQLKFLDALGVPDNRALEEVTKLARKHARNLKARGEIFYSEPEPGNRPFIHVPAKTLGEAWEKAVISVLAFGSPVHTYYDQKGKDGEYKHVPSREAKVVLEILDPFNADIHKNFPGGMDSLIDYGAEVIDGNKDHLKMPFENLVAAVRTKDPKKVAQLIEKWEGKWKYTYHERLTAYPQILPNGRVIRINQFEQMLDKLKREPLSKSIEAVTWVPVLDHNDGQIVFRDNKGKKRQFKFGDYDSPCFQRWWYRLNPCDGPRGRGYRSNLDTDWRSRCLYKAVPMNDFAFMMWKLIFDEKVEKELGVPIYPGTYFDHSNSLHLYGYYMDPMHPDKGETEGRSFLNDVLRMMQEPIKKRFFVAGTEAHRFQTEYAIETRDRLRKSMTELGRNPMKLDYLGRDNPLFPVR